MTKTHLTKICGITNIQDAEKITLYFPEFMGFVFAKKSPRKISIETAAEISDSLRICFGDQCPQLVGVFVNQEKNFLAKVAQYLDVLQFHGDESPEFCEEMQKEFPNHKIWKAIKISEENGEQDLKKISDYKKCDGILLDAFSQESEGGTGKRISKDLFPAIETAKNTQKQEAPQQILLMAGGITAENYQSVLAKTTADGVDLSSSLEKSIGQKSGKKIERFFSE